MDRRPLRGVLALVVQDHPNRAGPDLRGTWRNSLRHLSILSRVGASDKPGAVQCRITYGFWILPVLGLVAWAGIGQGGGVFAGLLLAALLIGRGVAAVHHAELVALRLGEPYGTLVLTLSVTIIELAMIVSLMLSGEPNPFLVRDTVQAVVILVVHGIAGACIVVGALRHREQEFQTSGASAFLAVLMPMVALVLILPNHTLTTSGPYYSYRQLAFVAVACSALYLVFLFVQTVRHREYFLPAVAE